MKPRFGRITLALSSLSHLAHAAEPQTTSSRDPLIRPIDPAPPPATTPAPFATPETWPGDPLLDSPEPQTRRRWYGYQTLIIDGLSGGVAVLGANARVDPLMMVGIVGYFIGAPITHLADGHVGKGFGSLALRGGPITVAAIVCSGASRSDSRSTMGCITGMGLAMLSIPAAVVLDATLIARETVTVAPSPQIRVVPWVTGRRGGASVIGSF